MTDRGTRRHEKERNKKRWRRKLLDTWYGARDGHSWADRMVNKLAGHGKLCSLLHVRQPATTSRRSDHAREEGAPLMTNPRVYKGMLFYDGSYTDEFQWVKYDEVKHLLHHEPTREHIFERSYEMALERLAVASKYIPLDKHDAYEADWKLLRDALHVNRGAEHG